MKLSDQYRLGSLLKERERLRQSIGDVLADDDVKVIIRGRDAQGNVRQACLRAINQLYGDQLVVNTKALQDLGIEVDDGPVQPTQKDRGMVMVEDRR